ncbi:hypothetical protein B0A48_07939 [Cryoendolithus antarcticus]|uniref:Nitrogen permease regulator 3 n=1 Tax=Cryoendolithus antarcticus TaxID=1507870 RepID=A0A1V8T0Y5_9PEZI|nr:hypothetical protein B0A48_07939 [Cryoendolithus antarcticus]
MGRKHNDLLAVLLVTRSRPGPKLVFCYPQSPAAPEPVSRDQSRDDEDRGSYLDTGLGVRNDSVTRRSAAALGWESQDRYESSSHIRQLGHASGSPNDATRRGPGHGPLLDINAESLERLLAPGRWSDGKKFEIAVDGVTFVGHPVCVKNDRQSIENRQRTETPVDPSVDGLRVDSEAARDVPTGNEDTEGSSNAPPILGSLDSTVTSAASLGTSATSSSSHGVAITERLDMFHVVFAVGASAAKAAELDANEIYEHIANPLSKALEYLERNGNYVSRESKKMLSSLQLEHRTDSSEAVYSDSELATALRGLFISLRQNEVASVTLDSTALSLLIPDSSAINIIAERDFIASAILLLDDKSSILSSLSSDPSSPLSSLVRTSKATKALSKIAASLAMPHAHVLDFARSSPA